MIDPKSDADNQPMRIDIISDVVCPWCIIGYKQLEKAQAATGIPVVVYWHPFELNPEMAEAGEDLLDHVARKYGSTREQSQKARERLAALGAELGFTFNYADDMRMVNSFRAHQLLHWAATQERQHQLKMALFSAYFTDRKNIDDPEVLAAAAEAAGLDPAEAKAVLADARFADQVKKHAAFWTSRGVDGVPTMQFDGRQALVGAQGVETYAMTLAQLSPR
ncbi:MAG: DsbA family oxidoreductase [Alphaproteobacteria bacterium]|nr:DsbA family oxidoreductase [Alphaproteobacteria bacterium]